MTRTRRIIQISFFFGTRTVRGKKNSLKIKKNVKLIPPVIVTTDAGSHPLITNKLKKMTDVQHRSPPRFVKAQFQVIPNGGQDMKYEHRLGRFIEKKIDVVA